MTAIDGHRSPTPHIRGVTDTAQPNYTGVLNQIRACLRDISRSTMTITQYREAARLLSALERGDEGIVVAPRDPRMHRMVVRSFVDLRRKLKRSAEPRVRETCEKALLALWARRTGKQHADTRECLFTLSNFRSERENECREELTELLTFVLRSPRVATHHLVAGPVWLHELLAMSWADRAGAWYSVASDVPDGCAVRGIGRMVLVDSDEESASVAALWDSDPDSEFFDPANALEAARLL